MDKEARKYKKALETLTAEVEQSLVALDKLMKGPPSFTRGQNLAKIRDYLDMANDIAMHFGLGWGFKKMENFKKRLETP